MIFAIGTALAFAFLDMPWKLLVLIPLALIEAADIALWLRWRKVRSITGAESVVGERGVALTDCRPAGQVKVRGQIWKAHCPDGVAAREHVVVTAVDGLRLEVARPENAPAATASRVLNTRPPHGR